MKVNREQWLAAGICKAAAFNPLVRCEINSGFYTSSSLNLCRLSTVEDSRQQIYQNRLLSVTLAGSRHIYIQKPEAKLKRLAFFHENPMYVCMYVCV